MLKHISIFIFLTTCLYSWAYGQNYRESEIGIFKLKKKVFYGSVYELTPGRAWGKLFAKEEDLSRIGQVTLEYAAFKDFGGKAIILRKGDKHINSRLDVNGKKECKALFDNAIRAFGPQNIPTNRSSNFTEYTWQYDEHFAVQTATYRVTNNRQCFLNITANP